MSKRSVVGGQCFQISQRLKISQRLRSNSSSSTNFPAWFLDLKSFWGPGIAGYRIERVNAPNEVEMKCYRTWLVLVATRKDFMEGAVRGEGYLDV